MGRFISKIVIALIFMLVLTGCGQKTDTLEILFFTEITEDTGDSLVNNLEQIYPESALKFKSEFYASVYERLIAEIASHNGDILIVESNLLTPGSFDSEGLIPFELTDERKKDIPKEYFLKNEKTKKDTIYALPIDENSDLLGKLNINLNSELVALVPIYSEHQDLAVQMVMEALTAR
ncbi:hypothetical protein ACFQ4N_06980 [Oceanobacillus iheyensis]|uniref:Hypothetical conserved protein n=1 Tax=Oceanobacillus iheyensis (strain DSM 14371 / CIP 107618 / JCM 11309 / KCTC 3954 / HTE831) TaxID=221109 RepID=Q8EPL6_OCEIH|nr:hypothetical protein [Oceanobacillus iheyensis]BAC14041.1 hypothetical conserved protein [Oceanobacillus iheyensis HTE831]